MNRQFIYSVLARDYGTEEASGEFTAALDRWAEWYRGEVPDFHNICVNNGITSVSRPLYRLNMAKKVCEEWADLLVNEKNEVLLDDAASEKTLLAVFEKTDFYRRINVLTEKTFALGTGAVTVRLDGVKTDREGRIIPYDKTDISLNFHDAYGIFPISWRGDRITECCFAFEETDGRGKHVFLQLHLLEKGEYVIKGRYFTLIDGVWTETSLPDGYAPMIRTGSDKPLFSIFRPGTANNLFPESPCGLSVYAGATDLLKGIDLCYDSLNMEFGLGRKMVFLRKDLLGKDSLGNVLPPKDIKRQLFVYVGDSAVDGDMMPKEFNPALRVNEHIEALDRQLDGLAVKCGLSAGRFSFNVKTGLPRTATEVISENSAMFRTLKKHEKAWERGIKDVVRGILTAAKFTGKDADPDCGIKVDFDDSVIEDRGTETDRIIALVKSGIITSEEAREKLNCR